VNDCNWFEQDSFWLKLEPFLFTPAHWEVVKSDVDGLIRLAQLQPGDSVLDLGCGPGRHSLELARRGFNVTAVDRFEPYLERVRSAAQQENLKLEIVAADMRNFIADNRFDLAVNLYTTFGYFPDIEEDRRILRNIFASLKPGGRLIMQMCCKERLARIFQPHGWDEVDGEFKLEERTILPGWSGIHNRWMHIARDGVKTEWEFDLRLYSGTELKTELLNAGFNQVELYGGLDGSPFAPEPQWLVAAGLK